MLSFRASEICCFLEGNPLLKLEIELLCEIKVFYNEIDVANKAEQQALKLVLLP
jgi:hypothetical protein